MSNSLIMMTTTTASSILADGVVPLTTIARRRGQVINSNGNTIMLNKPGYYRISATVTFTATTADEVVLAIQKNGENVVGLTASASVTTPSTEVNTLTISGIARVFCNESVVSLALVNSGAAITTSNVEVDVEYLG